MLSADTETALIREAKLVPELACITYSDGYYADIVHARDGYQCARWLLEQELTFANAPFDLAVMWEAYPDLQDLIWYGIMNGQYHDVIIRQKLIDIGAGVYRRVYRRYGGEPPILLLYKLSDLHMRYFHTPMEKDEYRLKYGELIPYPLHQWSPGSKQYAMYDPVATSRIHTCQDYEAAVNPKHNLWDEKFQVRANWALYLMSVWGVACDYKQVELVINQIDEEQPDLAKQLLAFDPRSRGIDWNGHNPGLVRYEKGAYVRNEKLAKALMYRAVGDTGELTDTGYEKVKAGLLNKDEALRAGYIKIDAEWCEVSKDPALIDYNMFRQNQLLRSKLEHLRRAAYYGLPIQTQYEALADTGRTTSSENKLIWNSMALQNPPRKPLLDNSDRTVPIKRRKPLKIDGKVVGGLRECFMARPGCTLIASDFGQAELVALAQITYSAFGYSKMRDLLNAGMDIHVDFGAQVYMMWKGGRLTYEDAWRLHKAKDSFMKDMRQAAKAADFGFPGGLGWASFQSYAKKAWGVELTGEQAKELKVYWLRHFPEMKDYFKWMSRLMEAGGGRADIQHYMSGRWRGKCYYTQGCNSMFQGLTADAAKAALVEVSRYCYTVKSSPLYGCHPVLFVHDEIITEAPLDQAAEAAKEKERIMVEVYQSYTPDVRITADAHLMDRWSKDAEAAYDERGKLVPWQPPQDKDEKAEFELMMAA